MRSITHRGNAELFCSAFFNLRLPCTRRVGDFGEKEADFSALLIEGKVGVKKKIKKFSQKKGKSEWTSNNYKNKSLYLYKMSRARKERKWWKKKR